MPPRRCRRGRTRRSVRARLAMTTTLRNRDGAVKQRCQYSMKMCHETNGGHPTSGSSLSSLRSQSQARTGEGESRGRGAVHDVPHVRLGGVLEVIAGGAGCNPIRFTSPGSNCWRSGIATRFTSPGRKSGCNPGKSGQTHLLPGGVNGFAPFTSRQTPTVVMYNLNYTNLDLL